MQACQLIEDRVHVKIPMDTSSGGKKTGHVVLLGVLNITHGLFGIGTSASRDHCLITTFHFLCAAVSLSLVPIKKKNKKITLKNKKMIATILNLEIECLMGGN